MDFSTAAREVFVELTVFFFEGEDGFGAVAGPFPTGFFASGFVVFGFSVVDFTTEIRDGDLDGDFGDGLDDGLAAAMVDLVKIGLVTAIDFFGAALRTIWVAPDRVALEPFVFRRTDLEAGDFEAGDFEAGDFEAVDLDGLGMGEREEDLAPIFVCNFFMSIRDNTRPPFGG